jgi:hypothetical protein
LSKEKETAVNLIHTDGKQLLKTHRCMLLNSSTNITAIVLSMVFAIIEIICSLEKLKKIAK